MIKVQITPKAIEYLAEESNLDIETASEVLQNALSMCLLPRDAEQRDEADGGTSTVSMFYTSDMGDAAHCGRCGRLVNSPNYAYHVCVRASPD